MKIADWRYAVAELAWRVAQLLGDFLGFAMLWVILFIPGVFLAVSLGVPPENIVAAGMLIGEVASGVLFATSVRHTRSTRFVLHSFHRIPRGPSQEEVESRLVVAFGDIRRLVKYHMHAPNPFLLRPLQDKKVLPDQELPQTAKNMVLGIVYEYSDRVRRDNQPWNRSVAPLVSTLTTALQAPSNMDALRTVLCSLYAAEVDPWYRRHVASLGKPGGAKLFAQEYGVWLEVLGALFIFAAALVEAIL